MDPAAAFASFSRFLKKYNKMHLLLGSSASIYTPSPVLPTTFRLQTRPPSFFKASRRPSPVSSASSPARRLNGIKANSLQVWPLSLGRAPWKFSNPSLPAGTQATRQAPA